MATVGRQSAISLLGAGTSAAAGVLVTVLLTRGLGQSQAGLVFAATSVFLVLESLGRVGADVGLVYFLSRQRALYAAVSRGTVRVALGPVLVISSGFGIVLFLVASPLALVIGGDPSQVTYLQVLALVIPFASLSNVALGGTRGLGRMLPTVVVERFGRSVLQLVLVGVGVLVGSGTAVVLGWSASYLPAAALSLLWLRRGLRHTRVLPGSGMIGGEFWRFTVPRALGGVAQVVLQRLDIVLVAALRGPADAAVYTAATRFLVVGQLASQALSNAVQPALSRALATGDLAAAKLLYQTSTAWLVLLVWPMFLSAAVFAPEVLALFGAAYVTGAPAMVLLSLVMLLATGCGFVDVVLIMAGRTSRSLINAVAALLVNIGLNVVLIPRIGLFGAAVGWAVAILVNNLVPLVQVKRSLGLHPFGRGVCISVVMTLLLFGLLPESVRLVTDSASATLLAFALATACYPVIVYRMREALGLERLAGLVSRLRGLLTGRL